MRKIDNIIPELNFIAALIVTIVIAVALQLSGAWITMLLAGVLGALFVRTSKKAFFVGFLGVGIAWLGIFMFLIATAQALTVADYFIGLLGLTNMGVLVIIISVLIGSLLGGFGALLGRSVVEVVDTFMTKDGNTSPSLDEG
jgi:hypothetical protein